MSQTIVCIDDEAHNNEALERLLRKKYKVFTATTPSDGLILIQQHQPALIISDQRMPQMTGVELLKQSVALSPDSIRILLTGYTDLESVIAAINEGEIYRYITKPWDTNDLLITVDKAVETHSLKQEVKKQNIELQSLDRLKTDFMVLVTHELRTPIAGISSFVELLKEELTNKDHKTYLKHVEKNTDRLKKLIEDILLITKLKGDGYKTSHEEIDPKNLFVSLWADRARPDLQLQMQGDEWCCEINQAHIKEIFSRLIDNCNQYAAPKSKVIMDLSSKDHSLKLSNQTEQAITVNVENLTNAFTKSENIMNHTQGTGLGLAVVKALTEALGGTLTLEINEKNFSVLLRFPKHS